jgi:hypothetical protein
MPSCFEKLCDAQDEAMPNIQAFERKAGKTSLRKKLSCWNRKLLSYGGRLVIINSVLGSLAMFMISFYEVLKTILKS